MTGDDRSNAELADDLDRLAQERAVKVASFRVGYVPTLRAAAARLRAVEGAITAADDRLAAARAPGVRCGHGDEGGPDGRTT